MQALVIHPQGDVRVKAGDRVDLLFTTEQGGTRILLENQEVVEVYPDLHLVIFMISPDDYREKMADRSEQGKFHLRLVR
jgi:hypothetical protein